MVRTTGYTATANGACLQGSHPSHRHKTMDFGKFYKTSYLDMNGNVIKKGSLSSPNLQPASGFHRPGKSSHVIDTA